MLRPAFRSRRWRTLAGVLAALLAAPAVAIGSASAAQADAVRQQELWVLNAINVAGAWQHTHGSGVTVALIDSGVNGQVSDLTGAVTTGRDFSGVNTPPTDPNWGVHGTWMASLIAGHGHAGGSSGIMGVAPDAKILSIRAVTDQGDPGYRRYQHESESRVQQHLADAINYATSKRVSVISMSLGYQGASLPVRRAISAALAQGIVVVASSGNSGGASSGTHGNAPYSFPADYPGVLGVGAVAQDGLPAGFSSDNLSVQVAAPGVRVPAQGRDGQYWLVSGTSPACALTAGVAALIKSVFPALAPALAVQAITSSTRNKPQGGYDEQVGFGTVDATAALQMAGRLARGRGTAHGLVAAAQFGGGTAAIPPVPVAPRTNRQFLVDSLIALACLTAVLILAFRLIATRRPAAAGVPGGWAGGGPPNPAAPGGWAGAGPAGPAAPGGWAGAGPAGPAAPGGWAGGGPRAAGPPAAGPPAAASGADGPGSDGGATGYGRPARYRALGGYKPPSGFPSPPGYGSSDGVQPHADHGHSASPRPAAPESAVPGPAGPGLQPDSGPPAGYGVSREPKPPAGHGPPTGNGQAAGYGPSASPVLPGAPGAPGVRGAFEPLASSSPDAKTGPLTGFGEPAAPHDLSSQAGDPPAADDDTWPSTGQW
jgi:Subtilase family